jgi:phosphoribosylaminoimidazole (AIR) synthetase
MPECGICGGEAPRQPCITEEGKCDLCGKKVVLAEEQEEETE